MIDEAKIRQLVEEKLDSTGFFITELVVKQGNNIQVFIDGDHDVNIDDCIALSRHIESNLDREQEDFNLQVSSAGLDQPLKFVGQYVKNIGRKLSIDLNDGSNITGKLLAAGKENIQIQSETQKGRKIISGELVTITYDNITKAICLASFK